MAFSLRKLRQVLLEGTIGLLGERRRRILAWRSILPTDAQLLTFERNGITWNAAPYDDIAFCLFVDGGHQAREIRALLDWMQRCNVLCPPRDVLLDVGANIGSTCVPIVRETGCRALAVEPVAANFQVLKRNVESNGLGDRIRLAHKAVLRTPGRVEMYLTKGASGGNFVRRDGPIDMGANTIQGIEEVDAEPLVAIVRDAGLRLDEIALVWADVQGCEAEVIESGTVLWEIGVPLWAEVEPRSLARQGSLTTFADLARAHFDRFIAARDLLQLGNEAQAVPIAELDALVRGITPEQVHADVLFLPRQFPAPPVPGSANRM